MIGPYNIRWEGDVIKKASPWLVVTQSVTRILSPRFKEDFHHNGRSRTMRSKPTLFAAVCVAALALSSSASATTILAFSQKTSTDFVNAAVVGTNSTTLTTNGPAAQQSLTSIPITITQEGNNQNVSITAFETFTPALTTSTNSSNTAGGPPIFQNGFNGTIVISQLSQTQGFGGIFLTAAITNGTLSANGASGAFNAANFTSNASGLVTVTLTSADPNIAPLLANFNSGTGVGTGPGAAALTLINITPTQNGSGFISFQAQNTGNFSTAVNPVPEPASFISAGTAVLAGLGCFGWSRRRSSQA